MRGAFSMLIMFLDLSAGYNKVFSLCKSIKQYIILRGLSLCM